MMDADQYALTRHRLITLAELARETTAHAQEFFDATALHEPARTSSQVRALMIACREFREESKTPLAALLADRNAKKK
jgi:hypothetical protein